MDYLKEFTTKLENLDRSKNIATVFKDFLTLCTCALAQPFCRSDKLEQIYLDTVKTYTKEQANEFSQMLALLVSALENEFQDFLGKIYMSLKIGSSANGQFFTPYCVSKMMSEINFIEVEEKLKANDFITLSDPCCGSSGMVIAFAETMKNNNYNYQKQLFVEVIDIDEMCFMMSYIQLALYGIPARVISGDSLAWKFQRVLYTPLYFVNGFERKLKQNKKNKKQFKLNIKQTNKQLSLFKIDNV